MMNNFKDWNYFWCSN